MPPSEAAVGLLLSGVAVGLLPTQHSVELAEGSGLKQVVAEREGLVPAVLAEEREGLVPAVLAEEVELAAVEVEGELLVAIQASWEETSLEVLK